MLLIKRKSSQIFFVYVTKHNLSFSLKFVLFPIVKKNYVNSIVYISNNNNAKSAVVTLYFNVILRKIELLNEMRLNLKMALC